MELNAQQEEAKKLAVQWFYHDTREKQVFYIAGAAGTGKTSSVLSIIEELNLKMEKDVAFATFTGKASLVLRKKGIPATTIHGLIYTLKIRKKGNKLIHEFIKKSKSELKDYKLFVIDECSMVGDNIWKDLLSFCVPILILGDINQLPPVRDKAVMNTLTPDYVLKDIIRQSKDNPLIQLSQRVINGELYLPFGNYGDKVQIMSYKDLTDEMLLNADVILCGKNTTRENMNQYIRYHLLCIDSETPANMDKLICRKNSWNETIANGNYCLINGMIGYCTNIFKSSDYSDFMHCTFTPDFLFRKGAESELNEEFYVKDNCFNELLVDLKPFREYNIKMRQEMLKGFDEEFRDGEKFEYGYCITTHLSQGSEWDNVLCMYEAFGSTDEKRKWLYTAITRSSNLLTLAYN